MLYNIFLDLHQKFTLLDTKESDKTTGLRQGQTEWQEKMAVHYDTSKKGASSAPSLYHIIYNNDLFGRSLSKRSHYKIIEFSHGRNVGTFIRRMG